MGSSETCGILNELSTDLKIKVLTSKTQTPKFRLITSGKNYAIDYSKSLPTLDVRIIFCDSNLEVALDAIPSKLCWMTVGYNDNGQKCIWRSAHSGIYGKDVLLYQEQTVDENFIQPST